MKKSVFTYTLSVLALVAFSFCLPSTTQAAEVTLTSGSLVVNCPVSENSRTGTVQLNGPDFDLHFSYDGSAAVCSPPPVRRFLSGGPGYDFFFITVTYQGVTTMFTQGSLLFDETSISGTVVGQNINFQTLFTVNFRGVGVGTFSNSRSTFEVCPVPEPATITLLVIGSGALGFTRRFRKKRTRP